MSDTPDNSTPPPPPSEPTGPWIYSSGAEPGGGAGYYTPPLQPVAAAPIARPVAAAPVVPVAAAPRAAPLAAAPAKPSDPSLAGIIDTIEAIIIALIIALTFRAFVVEAFVIPTGSMAPTLLGAHFRVICPKCGYEFERDAALQYQYVDRGPNGTPAIVYIGERAELTSNKNVPLGDITCPNCLYSIPPERLPEYLEARNVVDQRRGTIPTPFAWANNGDRILVLKYIYSILEPSRWDVIVFKEPQQARDNYIKRLIGRPGETIEIIRGDVYIAPPGETSEAARVIARKPDYVQRHVWQLVYDNDFYPVDEDMPRVVDAPESAWTNPWVPPTGDWRNPAGWARGTVMSYTGTGPSSLRFATRPPYTVNVLGYNDDMREGEGAAPVGDLHVETLWTPAAGGGGATPPTALSLTLGRRDNCYRVTWQASGLTVEQYDAPANRFHAVVPTTINTPAAPVPGKAYRITMNNVDHAVQFLIDDKEVLTLETPWTAKDAHAAEDAERAALRDQRLDAVIQIDVSGPCTLAHLHLLRDLYYTQSIARERNNITANDGHPLTLKADEFFAMGDNSRKSLDGRMWKDVFPALDDLGTRPGIVPRRYLLGKAFFVYWPAGFRPSTTLPMLRDTPIVPNTGQMRFIR